MKLNTSRYISVLAIHSISLLVMSSDPKMQEALDAAKTKISSLYLLDLTETQEYQSDAVYEELAISCLRSNDPKLMGNGIMLYGALADERRILKNPKVDIRAIFFENLDQAIDVSPVLVSGALLSTREITETEFLVILDALETGERLHNERQGTFREAWPGENIKEIAVANLEGNALDTFLAICEEHPEIKARVGGIMRGWIYRVEDIRASRIVLAEISDKDLGAPAIFNYMIWIKSNVTKELCRSNMDRSSVPFLDEYAVFLEKQANRGDRGISAQAIGDFISLGIVCPEYSEKSMALAVNKVDTWKLDSRANNIEKLSKELVEFTQLRANAAKSDRDKLALDEKWNKWKEPYVYEWKKRKPKND